jgi:hypothetical protein
MSIKEIGPVRYVQFYEISYSRRSLMQCEEQQNFNNVIAENKIKPLYFEKPYGSDCFLYLYKDILYESQTKYSPNEVLARIKELENYTPQKTGLLEKIAGFFENKHKQRIKIIGIVEYHEHCYIVMEEGSQILKWWDENLNLSLVNCDLHEHSMFNQADFNRIQAENKEKPLHFKALGNKDKGGYYYLYKDIVYKANRKYDTDEARLLIMESEDIKRKKFERLKKKFLMPVENNNKEEKEIGNMDRSNLPKYLLRPQDKNPDFTYEEIQKDNVIWEVVADTHAFRKAVLKKIKEYIKLERGGIIDKLAPDTIGYPSSAKKGGTLEERIKDYKERNDIEGMYKCQKRISYNMRLAVSHIANGLGMLDALKDEELIKSEKKTSKKGQNIPNSGLYSITSKGKKYLQDC